MSNRATTGRRTLGRSRVSMCGSKGGGSAYDPQVGAAAAQEAATAQQAQNWSQNYYTNTVSPLLAAETAQANTTTSDQNQLFALNMGEATQAQAQYNQYGIPAQDAYYNMVSNYSAPQEQESEAQAAIGDMRTSEASTSGRSA